MPGRESSSGPLSDEAGCGECRRECDDDEWAWVEERKNSLRNRAYLPVRSRIGSLLSRTPRPLLDDMTGRRQGRGAEGGRRAENGVPRGGGRFDAPVGS